MTKSTIVAVKQRHYSPPIPAEFLPLLEAAGIVVDDNDHTVIAYRDGHKYGSVWGPSVEGNWFAYREGSDPVRVPTRDDGLRHLLGANPEEVAA